jgi:mono/diheme cytochrome c family protein
VTAALVGTHGNASQLTAGRNVFVNRCIECHTLPRIRDYDPAEWPHLVNTMAPRANLTPAEHEALIAYILAARQQ